MEELFSAFELDSDDDNHIRSPSVDFANVDPCDVMLNFSFHNPHWFSNFSDVHDTNQRCMQAKLEGDYLYAHGEYNKASKAYLYLLDADDHNSKNVCSILSSILACYAKLGIVCLPCDSLFIRYKSSIRNFSDQVQFWNALSRLYLSCSQEKFATKEVENLFLFYNALLCSYFPCEEFWSRFKKFKYKIMPNSLELAVDVKLLKFRNISHDVGHVGNPSFSNVIRKELISKYPHHDHTLIEKLVDQLVCGNDCPILDSKLSRTGASGVDQESVVDDEDLAIVVEKFFEMYHLFFNNLELIT